MATSATTLGTRLFSALPPIRRPIRRSTLPATLHISLRGCLLWGFLNAPHSDRSSTNLLAWGHACIRDWKDYSPYTRFHPAERAALLDQDLTAWPPRLGGGNFVIRNRFHFVPGLRIDQPLVPTEVLRAVSSKHGTLDAVAEHVRGLNQLALPASPPALPPADMNAAYHAPNPVAKCKANAYHHAPIQLQQPVFPAKAVGALRPSQVRDIDVPAVHASSCPQQATNVAISAPTVAPRRLNPAPPTREQYLANASVSPAITLSPSARWTPNSSEFSSLLFPIF